MNSRKQAGLLRATAPSPYTQRLSSFLKKTRIIPPRDPERNKHSMRTDERSQAEQQCTYTATARQSSGHNPQYLLARVPFPKEEEGEVLREADS